MNLTKLFQKQKELDERINKEHGLEGQELLPKKILALQVELGELANELPEVFKFWSNKKNNYEKALKEYVDCLHFILSIGLECENDRYLTINQDLPNIHTLDSFDLVYRFIDDFKRNRGKKLYNNLVSEFVYLGKSLGFTWEQIEQAYLEKNEVNHTRQSEGY